MAASTGADGYDSSPAIVSTQLVVVAGAAAVMQIALVSIVAAVPAMAGLVGAVAGVRTRRRWLVELSAMGIFLGVVLAGIVRSVPLLLVGAAIGTVLVWDFGEQAITVGEQVCARAHTRRGELQHAAASTGVGVIIGGLTLVVHGLATGGFPAAALVALLVAALLLASAVRD